MKPNIFLSITVLALLCFCGETYAQDEVTLTTYYPAPIGEYESLAVDDPSTTGTGEVYTASTPGWLLVEGSIGIGTTEPQTDLHIIGIGGLIEGADKPSIKVVDSTNNTIGALQAQDTLVFMGSWSLHDLRFVTGGGTKMTIETNGNVGIGEKFHGFPGESPKNKLDVQGALAVGESYAAVNTAPSNGMIIEGNVGIGTASPQADLEVRDTLRLTPTDSPNHAVKGAIYYDNSENGPKYHDGAGWKSITGGTLKTYDSGWFACTTSGTYTKTHNLGTTAVLCQLYFSTSGGSNPILLTSMTVGGDPIKETHAVKDITTTQVKVQAGDNFVGITMNDSGKMTTHTSGSYRLLMLALV